MGGPPKPGRRERKKQATRARLIDAAAHLVGEQGYDNTTVQQIAEAVDVSPRTVAHYFPSKDGMLLAQVHAYADAVSAELSRVPMELPPLQAMLVANTNLLDRVKPSDAQKIATLLRTLHVAPAVQPLSTNVRPPALIEQMAQRLGVDPDDRRVELVFAVWSAVSIVAWSGAVDPYLAGDVDTVGLPALLRLCLVDAFDELVALSE